MFNGHRSESNLARVLVVDPVTGDEVEVKAVASSDDRARIAIRHMQNEDYEVASGILSDVVAEDPEDDRAWFALGLCHEWLGEYEDAVACYKKANLVKSDLLYQEARIRAEGGLY